MNLDINKIIPIKILKNLYNKVIVLGKLEHKGDNKDVIIKIIKRDMISQDISAETKIGMLLSKLGPNFVEIYGDINCMCSSFYFDARHVQKEDKKEKEIAPLITFPPLCYDKIWKSKKNEYDPILVMMTVMEYLPIPISANSSILSSDSVRLSILMQLAGCLQEAQDEYEFEHNDLDPENVLLKPTKEKYIKYKDYKIPLFGYYAVIIDYEYARILKPNIILGSYLQRDRNYDESHIPRNPSKDSLVSFQDISYIWYSLFERVKSPLDLFFGSHGLKMRLIDYRPASIFIPLKPVYLLDYLENPNLYLQKLFHNREKLEMTFSKIYRASDLYIPYLPDDILEIIASYE